VQPFLQWKSSIFMYSECVCSLRDLTCNGHAPYCRPWPAWLYSIFPHYLLNIGFGGLEVACWPLVPKFAGLNPTEAVGFFRGEKIFSTPSFGGEVKPSVPCHRFAACKRSLELRGSRILRRNLSEHFSPTKSSTFRC